MESAATTMHRFTRMSSRQTVLLAAVVFIILAMCDCQLTFSPGWGKRAISSGIYDPHLGNCRNPNEMLVDIFKYVQSVAQSYMDCHQPK